MITIIVGRAAQFLLALAMMRVATTLMSPEEMGRVYLVLTTYAFFALFLISPVGMFINRRLHAWQASGVARQYLIRYANYLLLITLFAAISLLIVSMNGMVHFGISLGWLIFLVCGEIFFYTVNQTAIPSINLLGDSKKSVLLSVATIAVSFACATLLIQTIERTAEYWLFGLLLGQLLLGIVGTQILFSRLKEGEAVHTPPDIQKRHFQALFGFAWPVVLAAGASWVQGQGYRYLIEGGLGLTQLGLFASGYAISAGIIAGFESILTTYFQPRLYRDASVDQPDKQTQAWQRYAAAVIPPQLLTAAAIMILAPELTHILLGKDFQTAADFVVWGGLAETARVLTGVYTLIGHVHMRTSWLIFPNLLGAVLSIVLCIFLIPIFGAAGAGMGLVISGFTVVISMHLLLARHVGGGTPMAPILTACISAVVLWGMTMELRSLLRATGWIEIIAVPILVGIVILIMQYFFLRQHMTEKSEL